MKCKYGINKDFQKYIIRGEKTEKEKLGVFVDAVLAIIMTILVLKLEKPSAPTFEAIWELKMNFFAYTLSFFWLGTFWINIHNQWGRIKYVSKNVVWWSIIVLFFTSFFPYATSFVSSNFYSVAPQIFYGIVVFGVTFSAWNMWGELAKANKEIEKEIMFRKKILRGDIALKILGFILTLTIYPPAVTVSVLVTISYILWFQLRSEI